MGLQSTAMPGNVNGEISFQPIQGSLGQPALAQSSPVQANRVQNGIVPAGVASPIQPQENLQGAYIGREDQLVPAEIRRGRRSRRDSRSSRSVLCGVGLPGIIDAIANPAIVAILSEILVLLRNWTSNLFGWIQHST